MFDQRVQYKTKHREELLKYLRSVPGRHFTVAEIGEYFHEQGLRMGTATLYRQLDKLVDEGLVNRYVVENGSPACYEYVGDSENCRESVCFHCRCVKCGRLIHLHCEELEGVGAHLLEEHGFTLDPLRTVFYGICETCKGVVFR